LRKRISKMISRNLYKRLERLEADARRACGRGGIKVAFVNSGMRPACVIGPDGSHIWWKPPEGRKVGEPVQDPDDFDARGFRSGADRLLLISFVRPGNEAGRTAVQIPEPTTVRGPDGRLVWLEPPEGYEEGEPIEDSADDPAQQTKRISM
jgi:hypothetical protein